MTFSFDDLLSTNEILADALMIIDDREQRQLTPGWYARQVKKALEQLNYQAPFVELFKDIELPENLIVSMPKGSWNIRDLFLWSGDECIIEYSVRVGHKTNFNTYGQGTGYTARTKPSQPDLFINNYGVNDTSLYFYYANAGNIFLSDACASYDNIRIVYNGSPTQDIDDVRFIPPVAREALIGYVVERAFFVLKTRDPKYRLAWADAKADLYQEPSRMEQSKWDMAITLLKRLDKKRLDDLSVYLSKMNY